jgi:phospholipid-binding lipoprotein MlaA
MRGLRALILGLCAVALAGCAGTPSPEALAANDPYEPANRQIMVFNGVVDRTFFLPTVKRYLSLPEAARTGLHNFLRNLATPTIFVNDVLQGKADHAGQSAARFLLNSSAGLGGFLDPATRIGVPYHGEDFGQTLGVWGAGEGPYLMLPLLGPSNPRDTLGLTMDTFVLDPTNYIPIKQHVWWAGGRAYLNVLDLRSQTLETLQGIERSSVDYYAGLRNLYRQVRDNEIRDGAPVPAAELPDF